MDEDGLIINLENVSFAYAGGPPVIDNVSLRFYRGRRMGLMGPNGSGKTTLFHLIVGLLRPFSGRIEVMGRPVRSEKDFRQVRRTIGLLFQDADDQLFSPTVLEDVAFGPLNLGKKKDEAKAIAKSTLKTLGLTGFEGRATHKLSGGEKRLVSLAAIMAMEPEVLLLDEPTTGLDRETETSLVEILTGLNLSYILVSHDIDFLTKCTEHILYMAKGRISFDDEMIPHSHVHVHEYGGYDHKHGNVAPKKNDRD